MRCYTDNYSGVQYCENCGFFLNLLKLKTLSKYIRKHLKKNNFLAAKGLIKKCLALAGDSEYAESYNKQLILVEQKINKINKKYKKLKNSALQLSKKKKYGEAIDTLKKCLALNLPYKTIFEIENDILRNKCKIYKIEMAHLDKSE